MVERQMHPKWDLGWMLTSRGLSISYYGSFSFLPCGFSTSGNYPPESCGLFQAQGAYVSARDRWSFEGLYSGHMLPRPPIRSAFSFAALMNLVSPT